MTEVGYTASHTLRAMRRTAVFVILLSLSGTPALGIVCDVLCAAEAHQKATGACHGDASGGPATRVAADHSCDHAVSLAPFVLDGGAVAFAPTALPVPPTIKAGAPVLTAVQSLAPHGGRVPSVPRLASVLRI